MSFCRAFGVFGSSESSVAAHWMRSAVRSFSLESVVVSVYGGPYVMCHLFPLDRLIGAVQGLAHLYVTVLQTVRLVFVTT